jgi:hypothetical protein
MAPGTPRIRQQLAGSKVSRVAGGRHQQERQSRGQAEANGTSLDQV